VLHVLRSLYANLKSCVRTDSGLTDFFDCTIGTRQGCILSPFLFSLYMNVLVEMLKCYNCQGVYVNEQAQNIMILLYADDVVKGTCTVNKRPKGHEAQLSTFIKRTHNSLCTVYYQFVPC